MLFPGRAGEFLYCLRMAGIRKCCFAFHCRNYDAKNKIIGFFREKIFLRLNSLPAGHCNMAFSDIFLLCHAVNILVHPLLVVGECGGLIKS